VLYTIALSIERLVATVNVNASCVDLIVSICTPSQLSRHAGHIWKYTTFIGCRVVVEKNNSLRN